MHCAAKQTDARDWRRRQRRRHDSGLFARRTHCCCFSVRLTLQFSGVAGGACGRWHRRQGGSAGSPRCSRPIDDYALVLHARPTNRDRVVPFSSRCPRVCRRRARRTTPSVDSSISGACCLCTVATGGSVWPRTLSCSVRVVLLAARNGVLFASHVKLQSHELDCAVLLLQIDHHLRDPGTFGVVRFSTLTNYEIF